MIYKKTIIFVQVLLCFLCISCKGQIISDEVCKENLSEALNKYNTYMTLNQDEYLLKESLDHLESSLLCENAKEVSVELKISILLILNQFVEGEKFVLSLKEDDFKKPYKQQMYFNYFKSKLCKEEICRLSKLKDIEISIEKYIEEKKIFEEEVYYDLFLIKNELLSEDQFTEQISESIKQFPYNKDFFETLNATFKEIGKVSLPN